MTLRDALQEVMHRHQCDEQPAHPSTDHMPWDEPDEKAWNALADDIIATVRVTEPAPVLDVAWKRVEEVLPEGWWLDYLMTDSDEAPRSWAALARKDRRDDAGWIERTGPTPAAALEALRSALAQEVAEHDE